MVVGALTQTLYFNVIPERCLYPCCCLLTPDLQGGVLLGGASGSAAAAVVGRGSVCGRGLQSTANLLHHVGAPPCWRCRRHSGCQVSAANLDSRLLWFQSGIRIVRLCFRCEVAVEGIIVSMVHCLQTGTVALQLEDGQIRKLLWSQCFGGICIFACFLIQ